MRIKLKLISKRQLETFYFRILIISDSGASDLKAPGFRLVLDALNPFEASFSSIKLSGKGFLFKVGDFENRLNSGLFQFQWPQPLCKRGE